MVHSRPESTAAPVRCFIALLYIQTSMIRTHYVGKALQGLCLTLAACGSLLLPSAAQAQGPAPDTRKWYLAEGAFNGFFSEDILVGNPNAVEVTVKITLFPQDVAPSIALDPIKLAPLKRLTVNLNQAAAARTDLPQGSYLATVECTEGCPTASTGIVVERTMSWYDSRKRGGHTSQGLTSLSKNWFLAEGATGFFSTFILLANPSMTTDANVVLTYFLEGAATPVQQHVLVGRGTRRTIFVNDGICDRGLGDPAPGSCTNRFLTGQAFSTQITSDADIAVERAMYWNNYEGGHESTAVTGPDKTWLFAEGATGSSSFAWNTFFLVVNPSTTTPAKLTVSFLRDSLAPLVCEATAPAGERLTFSAGIDAGPGGKLHKPGDATQACDAANSMKNAVFATKIESDLPIVAERTVYWSTGGVFWVDGHNTPGVNAPAAKWTFAEGAQGRTNPADGIYYDSYFLVSNPNTAALHLKVTFVRDDGFGLVWTGDVPAQQRYTILASAYPQLVGRKFATFIESQDGAQTFVAERAMYWGDGFYAGTGATGTPWSGAIAALAPAQVADFTPVVTGLEPNTGSTVGGTDVTIHGGNFLGGVTNVLFGSTLATSVRVVDNDLLVATAPAHPAGAVNIVVTNATTPPSGTTSAWPAWSTTASSAFTYVAPEVAPHLSVKFTLAFGDSITWGVTSRVCTIDTLLMTCSYDIVGYPKRVSDILNARYPNSPILIENAGVPGECVSMVCAGDQTGRNRFQNRAGEAHDLVVLLEGVNDLNGGRSVSQIIDAFRTIIQTAKAANKQIIIMTLPPGKPKDTDGSWKAPDPEDVAALNAAIETLKTQEAIPRVDLTAAFGDNYRQYLSPDGLHPNDAGYQRIANAVANKIIEVYETTKP
jgi:lysophospholipase L1-like esterase